jgi:hypothetical protein
VSKEEEVSGVKVESVGSVESGGSVESVKEVESGEGEKLRKRLEAVAEKEKPGMRLQKHIEAWEKVTSDKWVLDVVREGATLDLLEVPPTSLEAPERKLSEEEAALLEKGVADFVEKEAVEEIPAREPAFISRLFTITQKDGKKRAVMDARGINSYCQTEKFKMETLQTLRELVERKDWMMKVDIRDAYLHIAMAEKHRNYLAFVWRGRRYRFKALAFGISTAPRIFTKVMRAALKPLREKGMRMVAYLDDICILGHTKEETMKQAEELRTHMEKLGFILSPTKCSLVPEQKGEFLGFTVDTVKMECCLPEMKMKKLKKDIQSILRQPVIQLRKLASVVGKINATSPAVLTARVMSRSLVNELVGQWKKNKKWDAWILLPEGAKRELSWWKEKVDDWNGRTMLERSAQETIATDASETGWGIAHPERPLAGEWPEDWKEDISINTKELKTIAIAVDQFAERWRGQAITIMSDNKTAVAYVNHQGGTKAAHLDKIAREMWEKCMEFKIELKAKYIPGKENEVADELSRRAAPPHDWWIDPWILKKIAMMWGERKIDLFASAKTAQLKRYYSWSWDEAAAGKDAFAQTWPRRGAYAFPPVGTVGRLLAEIDRREIEEIVVVTPWWTGQPWFPRALQMAVEMPMVVEPRPGLINGIQHSEKLTNPVNWTWIVWRLSGKKWRSKGFQQVLRGLSKEPKKIQQKGRRMQDGSCLSVGAVNGISIPGTRVKW